MVRGCHPGSITLAIENVPVSKSHVRALDARAIHTLACTDIETKTEHLELVLPLQEARGLAMETQSLWVSGQGRAGMLIALNDCRVDTCSLDFSGYVACSTAAGH